MACGWVHIRVVLPVATFILAALVLRAWSPALWPKAWVSALLAWSLGLAYTEIGNLVCRKRLRIADGLDALSVQMFVASAQSVAQHAPVVPRLQRYKAVLWALCLAFMLGVVWQADPTITVNPCASTMPFIVTGRRDAMSLASTLGCVPVAWHMVGAWSLPAALKGVAAIAWLACAVATPPWLQCVVFAAVGTGCHPGLLVVGLVARRAPRVLPVLGLGVGAL